MTKLISITNLKKTYHTPSGEIAALENISLEINQGDFICIVGSSGCGKSTLLNILAGLESHSGGKITWHLKNPTIGYMFQDDTLFPWLSIYQNAALGLKIQHRSNKNYVTKLLQTYSLDSFKNQKPHQLSGGMKQRVG